MANDSKMRTVRLIRALYDMKTDILNDDMINDVVQHMNQDHSDACLAIVQTLGGLPDTSRAQMVGMDTTAIEFRAFMADDTQASARVLFDKPIADSKQIRGHLVSMAKRAKKSTLNNQQTSPNNN